MKQFAVIGLGNFGSYLASYLHERGHEVLAIDNDPHQVQSLRDRVNRAVVADATDREAMEALGVPQMDAAVICIGADMSYSILATLTMKDMEVKRILAMAISEEHGRVLEKVGASELLFPEKHLAFSLAERLHNPNMLDYLPITEGFSIIQLAPPKEFIGKSLRDLDLINRQGIQVMAIKETVPDRFQLIPTAGYIVKDSDILILLGPNETLEKLREKEA